jgi:hypothetical protein
MANPARESLRQSHIAITNPEWQPQHNQVQQQEDHEQEAKSLPDPDNSPNRSISKRLPGILHQLDKTNSIQTFNEETSSQGTLPRAK